MPEILNSVTVDGTVTADGFVGPLDGTAAKAKGLLYLEPTVTTAGVLWSATSADVTAYYDGLTVAVKCPETTASGLQLKINSLDPATIVFNATSAISTRYSANAVIIATYKTVNGVHYWSLMDYDANTDTKVRQYQTTSDIDYPVLTRYNTTDRAGTYEATYARFTPSVTINTSTGEVTAPSFAGNLTGTASRATADASGNTITTTYATKSEVPKITISDQAPSGGSDGDIWIQY